MNCRNIFLDIKGRICSLWRGIINNTTTIQGEYDCKFTIQLYKIYMLIREILDKKDKSTIAIKQGNKFITYQNLIDKSREFAKRIEEHAEKDSLTVGIFQKNSINYAISYFGILFANKIIVPIGIQTKEPELISTMKYCEVDIIVTDSENKEFVVNCMRQYEFKVSVYIIDNDEMICLNIEKKSIKKSKYLSLNGNEEDVVIMLHTSGTTSNPKRVMLSSKNLICNIESNIKSLKLTKQDKVLIAMPMFFGYCNTAQFLTHIYLGAMIVILDNIFVPKLFFQTVEEEKITNFTGVPTMLLMLLEYRYYDKYDFSTLRYICFGGGIMPVDKLKQLIVKYPTVGFVHTYGQTECAPRVTALLPNKALKKIGSVGKPIPGVRVRIVDMNDNPVGKMETGEIVVQGKNVMRGYYKQIEKTNAVIRDKWLHTGDLGYFDKDGYLFLTGRLKNMLISGGINIYPEEIEQLLLQHECVADALVVGKTHDLLGEVPVAKIVLKKKVSALELREFCKEKMAAYKIPVEFEIVNKLDKTYNGKVKRY